MGDDAGKLLARQHGDKTRVHGDGGVFRIAARGEGVGLVLVHHIDAGHRHVRTLRQKRDHLHQFRRRGFVDFLRAVGGERQLVRIPVGVKIRARGHEQGDQNAGLSMAAIKTAVRMKFMVSVSIGRI